jgi:hypothetical protein
LVKRGENIFVKFALYVAKHIISNKCDGWLDGSDSGHLLRI